MLHRLVASAFIMGGAVALIAPNVKAQTVDIPFAGTMPTLCSVSNPTRGVLVPNGPTTLTDGASGGSPALVKLSCLRGVVLRFSAPIQTAGPPFNPTDCIVSITGNVSPIGEVVNCAFSSSSPATGGNGDVVVSMSVTNTNGIPPGDYAYNVTMTIVAQ
jgi:hypothetical protein